jgi:hypothetical protein
VRIIFDPDFDRGGWPGPLGDGDKKALIGQPWAGPIKLRGHLEAALGLTGAYQTPAERVASLGATLRAVEGFWSESASQDALGSARTILRWMDWLGCHGWEGQTPKKAKADGRLRDLARLYPQYPAGGSDRLAAISAALDKRRADIESITSHEPIERLVPIWREIFAKLVKQGVSVTTLPEPASAAAVQSDLHRSLRPGFAPKGDGSLLLFRPYNPLHAAESVAVWLSALDDLSGVVIVSPDAALDEALRRFGLPATGARELTGDDPWLQILPLVLAMGWNPPDPQRALELLLLPEGPVPVRIARRLRDALQRWPSVDSPDWERALGEELAAIKEPQRRESVRERLGTIFRADAEIRKPYPAAALKSRAASVRKWAASRRHAQPEQEAELAEGLDAVIGQCTLFERLIDLNGVQALSEPQLLKLSAQATDAKRSNRRYDAQAGLAAVASPEAVAGPARVVVWWDFSMESVPDPFAVPFSRAEVAELASVGVALTPATDLAADQARRRRRPLLRAKDTLLLVCPVFGEDGEERHHHPLWDEVRARVGDEARLIGIETRRLNPRRSVATRTDTLLPVPAAKRDWSVKPKVVSLPERHSPTGLQDLIGCPFKWAMRYLGRLRDPESAALTDSVTLLGSLSHEILAEVLRDDPKDGEKAGEKAAELFETLGPKLAAPLFLPGAPIQIASARKATGDSARDLVEILRKAKLRVKAVETSVEAKTKKMSLVGRIDLVAGDPPVVIDLKSGGESYRRDQFKNGTALQLAAYSRMLGGEGGMIPAAFFIIRNQRLIAQKGSPFKDHDGIDGPPLSETWEAVEASALERLKELEGGRMAALAVPLEKLDPEDEEEGKTGTGVVKEDALEGGRIRIAPPCKFCSFGFLCGIEWEGGR